MPNSLPFYNPLDPVSPKIWPDYTLLMPICAVGNIGQLACDLIISTLLTRQQCQLIGRIHSPALMSVVGPNAFALKGPPTTSTEVYESKQHKLVIIQQRTSYFKSLKELYIDDLVNWIKESRFDKVLVLTSSFAQCNPDTSQLTRLMGGSNICSITTKPFEALHYNPNEWLNFNVKPLPDHRSLKVIRDGLTFLPGSGITKSLIKACERESIAAAFIVDFCSEGINIHDCYEIVNIVDKIVKSKDGNDTPNKQSSLKITDGRGDNLFSGWVEPFSWNQAQY